VRLSGFAQMNVNINQSRRDDEPFGIESFVGFAAKFSGRCNLDHAAIFEQEIVFALKMLSGVDEETVADCESAFIVQVQNLLAANARE
jgi:hypothetical protein